MRCGQNLEFGNSASQRGWRKGVLRLLRPKLARPPVRDLGLTQTCSPRPATSAYGTKRTFRYVRLTSAT